MTFSRRAATVGALLFVAAAALAWAAPFAIAADPGAVSIVDKTFDPSAITVHVGDTVTWTVTKAISEPHSVTSGTGSSDPNLGKEFNSDQVKEYEKVEAVERARTPYNPRLTD